MTPREQLDRHLARLVDAVFAGDHAAALLAFADAQSLPEMVTARAEAALWAAQETAAWDRLGEADLDGSEAQAARAVARVRREVAA